MSETNVTKEQYWKDVLGDDYVAPATKIEPTTLETKEEPNTQLQQQEPKHTELSDTELLKILNARGINASSFDDLKPKQTEEEIRAEQEKRKNNVLAFGLEKGKIKREDYDALKKAEANKLAIVLSDVEAAIREKYPELDASEIKDKIDEYTLANLRDDDVLKIARQKELLEYADLKLKNKYSSIYNLENDYSQYEQAEQSKYQLTRKVEAALPVYQNDIEQVINGLKKMEFIIEDKENPENNVTTSFDLNDDDLKELKSAFLNGEQALSHIKQGYTVEALIQAGRLFLLDKKLPAIVSKSAKDYNSIQKEKYLHGRKGIIPKTDLDISASGTSASIKDQFWKDVLPVEEQKSN